jgi:hypothetical protein
MRLKHALLLLFVVCAISGCKGQKKDGEAKMMKPVLTETVTLPTGQKVKRSRIMADEEKMSNLMTRTVKGEIILIEAINPDSVPSEFRAGTYMVTVKSDTGEMIIPIGSVHSMKKNPGKKVTFVGEQLRDVSEIDGVVYFVYKIKEIKSIE